jgi:hypothetical protein
MAQDRQEEEKVRKMRHYYYLFFLTQKFFRYNEKKKTVDAKVARYRQKRRRKAISSEKDKGHGGANHLQQDDTAPVSFCKKISYLQLPHSSFHTGARGTCLGHEEGSASARGA